MNQMKVHKFLTMALQKTELGESRESILETVKNALAEIGDPFAGEIDEFLADKQNKDVDQADGSESEEADEGLPEEEGETLQDDIKEKAEDETNYEETDIEEHPQEGSEDKVKEESEVPIVENKDPQEQLEEDLEAEKEESDEAKVEELKETQEESQKEIDKLEQQNDEYVESALRYIAKEARKRGHANIAYKFIKATAGGAVEMLNNLLRQEYLQRDVYVNYIYLFEDGSAEKTYLADHFKSESYRVEYLQKAIVQLGGIPTKQRLAIPPISSNNCGAVISLNAELERQGISEYLAAAKSLEGLPEYASLKSWLEQVANEEKEDKEEMEQL